MIRSKLRYVPLFVVLAAIGVSAQTGADSKLSQAWILGSRLSVAATMNAQSMDKAAVDKQFAQAAAAANAFAIKLPPLPARKGAKVEDSATALQYLLRSTGEPIGGMLNRSHSAEHAAIFEIALKANTLLILYAPGDATANTVAGVIKARSVNAKYLNAFTSDLQELIQIKATYAFVRDELFRLNTAVPGFLARIEYSRNGEAKYVEKDYAGSAAEFTKAIAIEPKWPEYYFGRGRALMQLKKNAEAIVDYTKVIQLEGASPNASANLSSSYHNRGVCYLTVGNNALALADLNKAIGMRPDYAMSYRARGMVYQRMGNAKLAAADLQKAEQLQPGITK